MLEDALDAPERLDHVRPVIIQVPELAVVSLMGPPAFCRVSCRDRGARGFSRRDGRSTAVASYSPVLPETGPGSTSKRSAPTSSEDTDTLPERVLPQDLVLLEVRSTPPPFIIRERVPIFLEERVDPRYPSIPGVLEIFERQAPVLGVGLRAVRSTSTTRPLAWT